MAEEKKQENPIPEEELDETVEAPGQEAVEETAEAPGAEDAPESAEETSEPKAKGFFGKGKKEPKKDQGQLLAEAADKYLRLAAEYDNYRKRTAKEKESIYQDARMDTIGKFLEVYDNLERAVQQAGDEENVHKKGMEMIFHQLEGVLEKMGVAVEDPAGQAFDPERHEAVMHIDSEELGENIVSQVFQKGFLLGEKVIRFAKVQVAN